MNDFFCYSCHKRWPVDQVKFIKDTLGRNRRVCLGCFQTKAAKKLAK